MKLNNRDKKALLLWGIRAVMGGCFIYASLHKIIHPAEFAKIIYGYDVFPEAAINLLAIWVPYIECVAGICLVAGFFPSSALLILNGLLSGFILIIGYNLIRGHQFDCGCFSLADQSHPSSAFWLLVRDAVLLGAGAFLYKHLPGLPGLREIVRR